MCIFNIYSEKSYEYGQRLNEMFRLIQRTREIIFYFYLKKTRLAIKEKIAACSKMVHHVWSYFSHR